MNGDIRAFFQKTPKKPESEVIEKKTIDISKDIKEIKPKEKKPKKTNLKKTKAQSLIEPESPSITEEKDNQLAKKKTKASKIIFETKEVTAIKPKTPILKDNNTITTNRNKKKIIDDDDDIQIYQDNNPFDNPQQPGMEIEEKPKVIQRQIIKPPEKKEKLINISVSDFFSMTNKDDVKNKFKELEEKKSNAHQVKDVVMNDINKHTEEVIKNKNEERTEVSNKMDIEKEDQNDSFIDINMDEIAKDLFDNPEDNTINNNPNSVNIIQSTPPPIQNDIFKYRAIIPKSTTESSQPAKSQIKQSIASLTKPVSHPKPKEEKLYQLWSEKYKPKTKAEIIGNGTAVNQLCDWLDHWDDVVIRGITREAQSSFGKGKRGGIDNVNARAVIVSGAPGIGKTSTVRLLATLKDYRTFELNASDQRNKEIINNSVGFLMNNKTLTDDKEISTKNLIIMDEVDGMGGNADKGGIAALINIVKKTKVPIIFICNDIHAQKLKSLINHCYDIRFSKPDRNQVVNRLSFICQKEGIKIDQNALHYLCDGFNSDIRQCINFLEINSKGNLSDMKEKTDKFKKDDDVVINSFEGCKKLLNKMESSKLNYTQRLDLFYIDYDLIPLLIYENYLSCYGNYSNIGDLDKIIQVSDTLSFSDILETRIRYRNDWSLLPDKGIHSALIPSVVNGGSLGFPRFPELFTKMSKMSKMKRQTKEIKALMPQASLKSIKNEVAPLLFSIITNNLVSYGKEGIDKIIGFFSKFKFTLSQIKDSLFDLQSESMLLIYTKLNNGIKSALTKKLNEQANMNAALNKKKGKKDKTVIQHEVIKRDPEGNLLEEIDQCSIEDVDDDNDNNEDDDSSSIFEPIPKAQKTKQKQTKKK